MYQEFTTEVAGKTIKLSTGKFAGQTDGAVVAQLGETVVLATVVMKKQPKLDSPYFPMFVEYEEKLYAAGKIKSSRFMKREGKAGDEATLSGRLIDRALRPLFNHGMRNELQVVLTILAYDGENDPDMPGMVAASTALMISPIPFNGPVAAIRMGLDDNGQFTILPTTAQREVEKMDLVVAAKKDGIIMVEAGAKQVPEETILKALGEAQQYINPLLAIQDQMVAALNTQKQEVVTVGPDEEMLNIAREVIGNRFQAAIDAKTKQERAVVMDTLEAEVGAALRERLAEDDQKSARLAQTSEAMEELFAHAVRQHIATTDTRFGGRGLDQIRDITVEVGLLPRTHGTGMFQRGETQALSIATLGAPGTEQLIDEMEVETKKYYMHHYNFPAWSVGEVAPSRGPGRREIGHGHLAERALVPVLPSRDTFPYVIRVVTEIMSANGSTSMASVCGSTLSLMDAGVPITAPVAGVAMGLIVENGKNIVITDIQGEEDHLGDMDFKVAGTREGVTAMQMDIKIPGISPEIMQEAVKKAHVARMTILDKMGAVIATPRTELSPYAPRIQTLKIDPARIKDVIGKGGETINKIIAETGVDINVEDDGRIDISSADAESLQKAVNWVNDLTREVKAGEMFKGKVVRIEPFGAFVNILPGQDGLVHISEFSRKRIDRVEDVAKLGDTIDVIVKEIDDLGRINLSHILALEKLGIAEKPVASSNSNGGFAGGDRRDRRERPDRPDRGPRDDRSRGFFMRSDRDRRGPRH